MTYNYILLKGKTLKSSIANSFQLNVFLINESLKNGVVF